MPSPNGRRECTVCPAWGELCGHWKGQSIFLGGNEEALGAHTCVGEWMTMPRWTIRVFVETDLYTCERSNCSTVQIGAFPVADFKDLPTAEADFRRREAALLGREAES